MTSRSAKATARTSSEARAVARTQTLIKGENGIGTVRRTTLPGGLRIVTETLPSVRSATFGIWAHVGSRDETPALNGATHYLEHLLFKGTATRSALDISSALDAVGGEMNAFTAKEYTCYYARVLDTDLPLAIDVVCDMLTGSVIREEDVDVERGAILEEIAMTEDDPGDCVHDLFAHTMFGDNPLGRPVLGTVDTVNALTADRIRRFYKKHYDPTHLVVACAGNVDHNKVVRQVRAAFEKAGALKDPEAQPIAPRGGRRALRTAGRVELLGRKTEQAHIVLGMPGLARTDERRWALGVLNTALGGGMSSRLFQEVREKRGLAYSVYSYTSGFADCGLFGVYAGCLALPGARRAEDLPRRAGPGRRARTARRGDRARHRPAEGLHRPRPGGHRRADEPYRQERAVLGRADVGRRHAGPDSLGHPGRRARGRPRRPGPEALPVGHRPAEGQAGVPAARGRRLTHPGTTPGKEATDMSKLRVAVLGARGRIGSEAVRAVEAAEDMELVAALGRGDKLETLAETGAQVAVELTTPASVMGNLDFCVRHGIHAVVGTTGWTDDRLAQLRGGSTSPRRRACSSPRTSPSAPC